MQVDIQNYKQQIYPMDQITAWYIHVPLSSKNMQCDWEYCIYQGGIAFNSINFRATTKFNIYTLKLLQPTSSYISLLGYHWMG